MRKKRGREKKVWTKTPHPFFRLSFFKWPSTIMAPRKEKQQMVDNKDRMNRLWDGWSENKAENLESGVRSICGGLLGMFLSWSSMLQQVRDFSTVVYHVLYRVLIGFNSFEKVICLSQQTGKTEKPPIANVWLLLLFHLHSHCLNCLNLSNN